MILSDFKENACKVSSNVKMFENTTLALEYVSEYLSQGHYNNVAVPDLTDEELETLNSVLTGTSIHLLKSPLRRFAHEIKTGITKAQFGIAETGSLVINSGSEDVRIASMLPDIHFVLINSDQIVAKASDLHDELKEMFSEPKNYTAFITGPSRTADIERVLSIGVHGPLELHILIIEN